MPDTKPQKPASASEQVPQDNDAYRHTQPRSEAPVEGFRIEPMPTAAHEAVADHFWGLLKGYGHYDR